MGLHTLSTGTFYVEAGGHVSTCLTILKAESSYRCPCARFLHLVIVVFVRHLFIVIRIALYYCFCCGP